MFELAEALKSQLTMQKVPKSDQDSLRKMVAGLGDQRGAVRLTFAQSLGSIGEEAIPILCTALQSNPNVLIRRASAKTLNIIGSEKALPSLVKAFQNDNDPVVQGSSAGAMATIGIPAIESLLMMLTSKTCSAFQIGLINLALNFIASKTPEAFSQAFQSERPAIRIIAITALAEQVRSTKNKSARQFLIQALNDIDNEVRAEAAIVVGQSLEPEEDVAKKLNQLLKDNSMQVRKNTALALMKMEAVNSVSHLNKAISSERNSNVKAVMKVAVNQLKNISN
ncbi:HEAT repeat domain-containing protein [Synechococcus sp. M16CYN]|uniref:HEAT repeat domain-containing protein n=1 Tax=Synechococcus sp. M16CYN TaxID=3103139 RepID=UPI00324B6270